MFWSFGPTFATQNEIMYHSSGRGVTREAISIYQGDDIVAEITEVKQMSTTTINTGETGTTTTTTKLVTSTPKITITNAKTITAPQIVFTQKSKWKTIRPGLTAKSTSKLTTTSTIVSTTSVNESSVKRTGDTGLTISVQVILLTFILF